MLDLSILKKAMHQHNNCTEQPLTINFTNMKLSARNQLKGKILKVEEGLITAKVVLDLGNDNIISAIISKDAIAELDLKPGMSAFAVIKSTEVIIGTPCNHESSHCSCK
jgi:molybdopterin-binding protein